MIITLCGSTRFRDEFYGWAKRLTYNGHIVLMPNIFGHCGDNVGGIKEMLDKLHHDKIRMSDRIDILCPRNYIGKSTAKEIEVAEANGIVVVKHMEPYCYNYDIKVEPGLPLTALKYKKFTRGYRVAPICRYLDILPKCGFWLCQHPKMPFRIRDDRCINCDHRDKFRDKPGDRPTNG
jgi:hypothetical protein